MFKQFYKRANEVLDRFGAYFAFRNYTKTDHKGDFPKHGAVVLSSYMRTEEVRIEWMLGELDAGFTVKSVPDEAEIGFRFAIPGISLYLTFESYRKLGELTKRIGYRQLRIATHDGSIWWETPLADPNCGPSDEPWYVRGNLPVLDLLFGKPETKTVKTEGPARIEINMPEGTYSGVCEFERRVIGRPRWFGQAAGFARIGIDAPHGIPFPGKGENSYDIDDDAIYTYSTEARSPADAIGQLVGRVLHLRWTRGGKSWRPTPASNDGGVSSGGTETPNVPSSTLPPSDAFTTTMGMPVLSVVLN